MSIWHTTRANRCGVFSPVKSTMVTINGQAIINKGFSITVGNNLVLDTKNMGSTVESEAQRCWGEDWPAKLDDYLKKFGKDHSLYPGLPGRPDVESVSEEDAVKMEKAKTAGVVITDGRSLSGKQAKRS